MSATEYLDAVIIFGIGYVIGYIVVGAIIKLIRKKDDSPTNL